MVVLPSFSVSGFSTYDLLPIYTAASLSKTTEDEEIEMDPGNKSDYRRVQIDRKPSSQHPPTLGKARNNCLQ